MGVLGIGNTDKTKILSNLGIAKRILEIIDENAITIQELLESLPAIVVFSLVDANGQISVADVSTFSGSFMWNLHGLLLEPLKDRLKSIEEAP